MRPTPALVADMPKVELHVHLEGTFSPERIVELAAAADEPLPRPIERIFEATDLAAFLETLDWVCGLVRSPATAEQVAFDFARYAHAQRIVYAEAIANPTHWSGLDAATLLTAFAAGFDRAAAEGLCDVRLLPSILRQQTEREALALVAWMSTAGIDRIVGLSIDGDESQTGRTAERFAPAYRRAAAAGFGCTAHAGESSGPEGVRDAIEFLGASRIDHGVRCGEDEEVLALVLEHQTTLNVCLTSNCTLLYDDITDHPVGELVDAGVPITINTDDPETLGVDLCSEIELAARHLEWDMTDLVEAQRRAIDASFCAQTTRDDLHAGLDDWAAANL